MRHDARVRIDSHRLMQGVSSSPGEPVVVSHTPPSVHRTPLLRRVYVHVGAFFSASVFSIGASVILLLLFVRSSEDIAPLVFVGIIGGMVFVACFVFLRMFILHHYLDEYPDKEEDPGMHHHLAKSVVYGCLALIIAILLGSFLAYSVSAFS
jgi:hypothetical protein